jgi:hypothetical protein
MAKQYQYPEPKTCIEVLCTVMSLVRKYFLQKSAMLSHVIPTFCAIFVQMLSVMICRSCEAPVSLRRENILFCYCNMTTGWTVRGSKPGGGEIFRTRPDRPWGAPSHLYNGYLVFPGGKAAGAWC